jgi:ribosomal protein S8
MTSTVSNVLALITGGYKNRRLLVRAKRSKLSTKILNLFYNEGFIRGFTLSKNSSAEVIIFLKYVDNKPVLKNFKVFSSGGRRTYCKSSYILTRLINNGYFIVSTSQLGLVSTMTLSELRNKIKCGGELLFKINF